MNKPTILPNPLSLQRCMPTNAEGWAALTAILRPYIQNYIYKLNLNHWRGGEEQLVEDALHETFLRAIPYARDAENGIAPPVGSFEALCKTIARHYLVDLHRKDKRLVLSIDATSLFTEYQYVDVSVDPSEGVIEDMSQYSTMLLISTVIKDYSPKLKEAMLIHLANMEDFDDEQPRPLERALWAVGISLREYRRELPKNPVLRRRHATLVCLGLKTLRQTFSCHPHQPDNAA